MVLERSGSAHNDFFLEEGVMRKILSEHSFANERYADETDFPFTIRRSKEFACVFSRGTVAKGELPVGCKTAALLPPEGAADSSTQAVRASTKAPLRTPRASEKQMHLTRMENFHMYSK